MQYFRDLKYNTLNLLDELCVKIKHPKRDCEVWYHFSLLYNDAIYYPFYYLVRGIKNFWKWKKVIWCNDVYDHVYMLKMIDKQLNEMYNFWASGNAHVVGDKHIPKRIKWCRKLLQMCLDEYYSMKHFDEFAPSSLRNFDSEPCEVDEYGATTMYELVDKSSNKEREIYRNGINKAYEMDEKVWKLFIKNFSKCREWWV